MLKTSPDPNRPAMRRRGMRPAQTQHGLLHDSSALGAAVAEVVAKLGAA